MEALYLLVAILVIALIYLLIDRNKLGDKNEKLRDNIEDLDYARRAVEQDVKWGLKGE